MGSELTIADLSSLIVAAAAVGIAFYNGYATRRHYRLTVRPRFKLTTRFRGAADSYGVKLVNGGLGPGVVTSVTLLLDGKPVEHSHEGWLGALREVGLKDDWSLTRILVDTIIPTTESIWLCRAGEMTEAANAVIRKLSRIDIIIEYESLYEEEQPRMQRGLASRSSLVESEATNNDGE